MRYRVDRVRPQDWELYREIRLRMLRDTPLAYLERYEDALGLPRSEWEFRANRHSAPGNVGLVGVDGTGRWVGVMNCFVSEPGTARLVSVWVHPDHRGREHGLTDLLLDAVLAWVRQEAGVHRLVLEVHEDNARAMAYYRRRGFVPTGHTVPYPLDPSAREMEMDRAL